MKNDHSEPCGCRAIWWPGLTGFGEWMWVVTCPKHHIRMDHDLVYPDYHSPTKGKKRPDGF